MNDETSSFAEHLVELWPYFKLLRLCERIIFVPVFVIVLASSIVGSLPETGLGEVIWRYSVFGLWAFFLVTIWMHVVVLFPYIAPGLTRSEESVR